MADSKTFGNIRAYYVNGFVTPGLGNSKKGDTYDQLTVEIGGYSQYSGSVDFHGKRKTVSGYETMAKLENLVGSLHIGDIEIPPETVPDFAAWLRDEIEHSHVRNKGVPEAIYVLDMGGEVPFFTLQEWQTLKRLLQENS